MNILNISSEELAEHHRKKTENTEKNHQWERESKKNRMIRKLVALATEKTVIQSGSTERRYVKKGYSRRTNERSSEVWAAPAPSKAEPYAAFDLQALSIDIVRDSRLLLDESIVGTTIMQVTVRKGVCVEPDPTPPFHSSPILEATVYPPSLKMDKGDGTLEEVNPDDSEWSELQELANILDEHLPAPEL